MFCSKCGAELPDSAVFCKSCGNKIAVMDSMRTSFSNAGYSHSEGNYNENDQESDFHLKRLQLAQIVALASTAIFILSFAVSNVLGAESLGGIVFCIGLVLAIVSYVMGGIMVSLRMGLNIMKWGLIILPFPSAILSLFLSVPLAILVSIFIPIIPVRKAYLEYINGNV